MAYDFTLVDVFTDRPFGGNQLAVFPDARGIPEAAMQRLAREFNFSETSFVLPPQDPAHTCRVRIFTPHQELPFAGHPTLGTAAALAARADGSGERTFVFEENVGPVSVSTSGQTVRLHLRTPAYETTTDAPSAGAVAAALALPEDAVRDIWCAGVGLRYCFVQLADRELVDRATLDRGAWETGIAREWSPHLYFFAGDFGDGAELYARAFAPAMGVEEDPATGSACAALIASLAQRSPAPGGTYQFRIHQGVAMGRASILDGTAHKANGRLTEVIVGGSTVMVGHGTISIPLS